MRDPATLVVVLDLLGVFVFALSGATLAVQQRLDAFGVLVLAGAAALGGGVLRDVLLGLLPPAALVDVRYLLVPPVAAALVFFFSPLVERLGPAVRLFDAAGLGLFVVAGTAKALNVGLEPVAAVVVGLLTGIGGGVVRDLLAGVVPVVLRRELYAVPALAGAVVVVVSEQLDLRGPVSAALAVLVVFGLRMLGVWRDWHAPVAPQRRPRRG